MKLKLLLCLVLVLSGVPFVQHAFGMMEEEQLSSKDAHHSHCSVKAESTDDGIHFTCRMPKMKDCGYRGCLQIYDRTNLIAICPHISALTTIDGKFVQCEFTVAKGYLDKSRFFFLEMFLDRDGRESTTGTDYWFYLRDFADAK
jgi:hypothetical protein